MEDGPMTLQRKLTKAEISYIEDYVNTVRTLGGINVSTREVYDARHTGDRDRDGYTRSYKQGKVAKALQKAGQYGYLDVVWDGRTYRATLPEHRKVVSIYGADSHLSEEDKKLGIDGK